MRVDEGRDRVAAAVDLGDGIDVVAVDEPVRVGPIDLLGDASAKRVVFVFDRSTARELHSFELAEHPVFEADTVSSSLQIPTIQEIQQGLQEVVAVCRF